MDEGLQKLKAAILLLENMDDMLIDTCRGALQFSSRSSSWEPFDVPSSEADLRLLEVGREGYRNSNYAPQDMVDYLASFPNLKRYWQSVARTVVSWRMKATLQPTEWHLRTKQLQDAGDESWRAAVPATNAIAQFGSAAAVNALTAKFRLVDDILNPLYDSIPELGARQSFGDEYNDTLLAMINISKAEGPSADLTIQKIDLYKSELRLRRRAPILNMIDTSTQQSGSSAAGSGSPTQSQSTTGTASSILITQSNMEKLVKFNPTTLGITLIITLTSALLTVKAWQYSAPSPGTTHDADFWFLLQSCLMQLAGLFPITLQLWTSSSGPVQPRLWSWFFTVGSLVCSITAPILYVFVPTAISAVVSFCGSVLQVFVLLEALVVTEGVAGEKVKKA